MTRRDLGWRAVGAALLVAGCAGELLSGVADAPRTVMPAFIVAIAGIVFLACGKRVVAAFRVELGSHRNLPRAIHARHRQRTPR